MVRHFISQNDFSATEMQDVFSRAAALKRDPFIVLLAHRTLVMFFEKSSTRTRLSFEIGMTQLGGHAVYLDRDSSQLSRGESIKDTALVVSRYADVMMARVNAHATVSQLAEYSTIPVINGLSDEEHPCQSMADLFTIQEHHTGSSRIKLAYVGDGDNNVTHSLLLGATTLGWDIRVAAPRALQPQETYVHVSRQNAEVSGSQVLITEDPQMAVAGADVVYTDVWVSMGREGDAERRRELLNAYQVNSRLVSGARPDYLFMHCLPAHIGDEVTADVAYGPNSVIFDEAENRLHVQKALMVYLLGSSQGGE